MFLDRAANISESGSASIAERFDSERHAWMEAVAAGEMNKSDWHQDPEEVADSNDQTTDD